MNIIDELNNMNIDFNLHLQRSKADKFNKKKAKANHFTDKKLRVAGTKIEIKEIQAYRAEMGLAKLILKIRQCLRCYDKFHSHGAGNRMCEDCAKS